MPLAPPERGLFGPMMGRSVPPRTKAQADRSSATDTPIKAHPSVAKGVGDHGADLAWAALVRGACGLAAGQIGSSQASSPRRDIRIRWV